MSYSTPDKLAGRIGPRIYFGLTAEQGSVPDERVAQGMLDKASLEIDLRIGTRYVVPIKNPPAPQAIIDQLGAIEEQICFWFLYVYRGFDERESAAAAAKIGYDNAMKWLDAIADAKLDLPGAPIRVLPSDVAADGGFTWGSETPVFTPPNETQDPFDPSKL